jgi:hypothetical protein
MASEEGQDARRESTEGLELADEDHIRVICR